MTRRETTWAIAGTTVGATALFLIGYVFWHTETGEWLLTGRSWQRTIAVEDFQPRHGSGWDETVPSDAYDVSCYPRKRDEDCSCISRDEHGFCTNEICTDVYDDYCTYTIDRWQVHRVLVAGNAAFVTGDPRPAWPDLDFTPCSITAYGCEREGARAEQYLWHLTLRQDVPPDEAYTLSCTLAQSVWADVAEQSLWHMVYNPQINRPHCDTLEALN